MAAWADAWAALPAGAGGFALGALTTWWRARRHQRALEDLRHDHEVALARVRGQLQATAAQAERASGEATNATEAVNAARQEASRLQERLVALRSGTVPAARLNDALGEQATLRAELDACRAELRRLDPVTDRLRHQQSHIETLHRELVLRDEELIRRDELAPDPSPAPPRPLREPVTVIDLTAVEPARAVQPGSGGMASSPNQAAKKPSSSLPDTVEASETKSAVDAEAPS